MRIRGFSYVVNNHLEPFNLNNSTVVIDGNNFFYRKYLESKLPFALGSESNRFADYLRACLDKFVKANVDCYFVFKGGHDNQDALNIHFEGNNRLHGKDFEVGYTSAVDIVRPVFVNDICFEVLEEMGFKYVISTDNIQKECIVLARKLSCPVIAFNVEYLFSTVQYISDRTLVIDEYDNLKCGIITLSSFLKAYNLTEEKIVLFAILTDEFVFEVNTFTSFFKSINLPLHKRYTGAFYNNLLKWLASQDTKSALSKICKYISASNKTKFYEKIANLEQIMRERKETETKITQYLLEKNSIKFSENDCNWLQKGVFLKHIPSSFVNLYKYKILKASNCIEDYEQENSIILSIDIVKYAFDLLTNFKGGELHVIQRKSSSQNLSDSFTYDSSIQKPDYVAENSVFENGWERIKDLNLFQHFLKESLQSFNISLLNKVPADSRLLLIAMVYFSRKKAEVKSEICSILLSYVMLAIVEKNVSAGCSKSGLDFVDKPIQDSFTDKSLVTATDSEIAWCIMTEYFTINDHELEVIFDRKILHPLVEFQFCLQEFNYLNQLCGAPYANTVYSKTYNGTLVYKILYYMKESGREDGIQFIIDKLSPAPTVLAFLTGMLEIYEQLLYDLK